MKYNILSTKLDENNYQAFKIIRSLKFSSYLEKTTILENTNKIQFQISFTNKEMLHII